MWQLSQEGIDQAREALRISHPVRVRLLSGGPSGQAGKYHGVGRWGPTTEVELDEPAHHISLNSNMSATMANVALRHELAHAGQAEEYIREGVPVEQVNRHLALDFGREMRFIRFMHGSPKKQHLDSKYAGVSFEVEARQVMNSLKMDVVKDDPIESEKKEQKPRWRYKLRVDLWKKNGKFRGTFYVTADGQWSAEDFAKKEWGEKSDRADSYIIEEY